MTDDNKVEIEIPAGDGNPFKELEPISGTAVAPAHGIAAIALNMAMKYHDIAIIKDGTMYQQYKMEGRNIQSINLNSVFETAMQIEAWLLGASERIAKLVVDAIEFKVEDDEQDGDKPATAPDVA